MSYSEMGKLIDRWLADASFRAATRTDPEGTARGSGVTLTTDEWAVLRSVDWTLSDEQLKARINKL